MIDCNIAQLNHRQLKRTSDIKQWLILKEGKFSKAEHESSLTHRKSSYLFVAQFKEEAGVIFTEASILKTHSVM